MAEDRSSQRLPAAGADQAAILVSEGPATSDPAYQGATQRPADRRLTPGSVAALQRAAGNRAVGTLMAAATPVVQRRREDKKGLLDMTVAGFDRHRKAEQMDWANLPELTAQERTILWGIVEWGTGGLAPLTVREVLTEALAKPQVVSSLKSYCNAIGGKLNGGATVPLVPVDTLANAVKQGHWIERLTALIGGSHLKAVMPRDKFELLIADEAVAEKFVEYYKACAPVLQTPTGEEFRCFVVLVRNEGGDILGKYKPALPNIRNYHKFSAASLDKLIADNGQKDLPLTVIFYALFDHNGAFHRDADVAKIIANTHTRVFLVEGMDVAQVRGMTTSGIQKIATAHGADGKITQVVMAGHGNPTMMEMAGSGTKFDSGKDRVATEGDAPLYFGNENFSSFWTQFFDALTKNMETKGGLNPKILLNACLTNANDVDTTKLKELLKGTHGLDVDDKSVDPKSDKNQATIRQGIQAYIAKHGSLATVLGSKTSGKAEVLGANASITASSTESIHKDTGELALIAMSDSKIAAPKIEYVRHGKEPVGAIRAVIESWAIDPVRCFAEMDERRKEVVSAGAYDDFIIRLLYGTIRSSYANDILGANAFSHTAHVLHGVAAGSSECRAAALRADPMVQKHKVPFLSALEAFTGNKFVELVLYQDWMAADATKRAAFVRLLGHGVFDRDNVVKYVDYAVIAPDLAEIFKVAKAGGTGTAAYRGGILLALIGLLAGKAFDDCKAHLLDLLPVDRRLPVDVTDELMGTGEDSVRELLGLPPEVESVAVPISLGTSPPKAGPSKNVDTGGSGNDYYVEPRRPEALKMTKAGMLDFAKLKAKPDDAAPNLDSFYRNKDFVVVGEVKDPKTEKSSGWYMVRTDDGRVAYMRTTYF